MIFAFWDEATRKGKASFAAAVSFCGIACRWVCVRGSVTSLPRVPASLRLRSLLSGPQFPSLYMGGSLSCPSLDFLKGKMSANTEERKDEAG